MDSRPIVKDLSEVPVYHTSFEFDALGFIPRAQKMLRQSIQNLCKLHIASLLPACRGYLHASKSCKSQLAALNWPSKSAEDATSSSSKSAQE